MMGTQRIISSFLLCLIIPLTAFASKNTSIQEDQPQITAEQLYSNLDKFLSNPSPAETLVFKKQLTALDVEKLPAAIKLAKVISLCNLGFYESRYGKLYDAITTYSEAWSLYTSNSLKGYDIINSCAIPLGNLYTQTNAFEEAARTIEQYILIAEKDKNYPIVTSGIINLSALYQSQGRYLEAKNLLEKALQKTPNTASLWMNLASTSYALGDTNSALQQSNKVLALDPAMSNVLKLQALVYTDQKEFKKAEIAITTFIKALEKDPKTKARDIAKGYLAFAEIQLANDILQSENDEKFKKAINTVYSLLIPSYQEHQKLPNNSQLYGENTLLDALEIQARYFEMKDDTTKAIELLEKTFEVVDQLNHKELLQGSRLLNQSGEKERCERYLNLTYTHLQTSDDQKLIEKALLAVDRVKSRIATDNFNKQQRILLSSGNQLLNKLQALEERQATLDNELFYAKRSASISDSEYLALLKASEANRAASQVEYSKFDSDEKSTEMISLQALHKKTMKKKETYVNYFVGSKSTFQFIIQDGEASMKLLTSNKTEQQLLLDTCREFNRYFTNSGVIANDPKGYSQTAYDLYRLLAIPDAPHLVISPDGILSFIPFDALLTQEDNAIQFATKQYLIKKSQTSFVLSTALYLSVEKPLSENPSILGLFPVFEQTTRPLTYSLKEAEAIHSYYDMTSLTKTNASQENFFASSNQYNILHLSTHASAGSFNTPALLSFIDKDISVDLLYGQQWSPDLVVLSACETGVGKIIKGEGAQSLARGFHYAGAKNILFSQWKVNDRATATLMGDYYKNLKQSQSRNTSLQRSKLNFLENTAINDLQKSPYYWASFTYYGTTDAQQIPDVSFWLWGLVIIVVLLMLITIIKYAFTSRVPSI